VEQHVADTVPDDLNVSNYLSFKSPKPQETPALAPFLRIH
jgi:hypothetical protein